MSCSESEFIEKSGKNVEKKQHSDDDNSTSTQRSTPGKVSLESEHQAAAAHKTVLSGTRYRLCEMEKTHPLSSFRQEALHPANIAIRGYELENMDAPRFFRTNLAKIVISC